MDFLIDATSLVFVQNTFSRDILWLRRVSVMAITCLALGS